MSNHKTTPIQDLLAEFVKKHAKPSLVLTTVGDLIFELQKFKLEQPVQVLLYDRYHPGSPRFTQLSIQYVVATKGWHTDPNNPDTHIVRIVADRNNIELPKE